MKFKTKFETAFYVIAHRLARSGANNKEIAATLGVRLETLKQWMMDNDNFSEAVASGRQDAGALTGKDNTPGTFSDYVYRQLDPHLQTLYDQLHDLYNQKTGRSQIEALMAGYGAPARQALFIHAWVMQSFSLTRALRLCGVPRCDFNKWCRQDPAFHELVFTIEEYKNDFFEDAFIQLVRDGNDKAILHAVKTRCRHRGYGDVTEERSVGVEEFDYDALPLEDAASILDAIEAQEEKNENIVEGHIVGPAK